ncbi:cation diffusion facilitator family transporter [Porticoccaceae bacterium]|jgi:ferrous-iron efflux pump FieF|nr:cation diffusion facilitator family transporter [Porticoccaceae bacterium]MDA8885169.1 cation diffusion facilitator family transporter [Porticoccaceae bacterium]MDA8902236.1 cation diffusion facilitator family transporter [Porticoccaceae bacterium]MDA8919507.1 cation diffusion facilitator family transporter [Porticoccaceae bacterium]MDA8936647.1 cation diffusion facilitator family transporter [Porticoccaceae bacterium]
MTQSQHLSKDPAETAKLLRLATYASISVALILIVAKLIAWGLSDSVSLLATLIDSVLDALASLINLIAVRHALTPADKEHRFGHGKAEALAGLSQSMFIAGSAGFLLLEAGRRLISPIAVESVGISMLVMVFSIVATLLLLSFQAHVIRKTNSTAIRADALHYRTDLLVNASVILALWLSVKGWAGFDALFACAIAIYILYSAWEIITVSYDHLMDRELPDEQREEIERLVLQHKSARGLHDLRSRHSGTVTFIQLHLELDDDLSLLEAHKISDEVELCLLEAFPGSEIIIHIDPQSAVGREAMADFS